MMNRTKSAFAAALMGLSLVAIGGCMEGEKMVYKSTPHVPQTITIVNTVTGEQVWSYDVPPNQELTLHFTNRPSRANELGYDEMTWTIGPAGAQPPSPTNRIKVPPPDSRRIDGTIRPGPELATGMPAKPAAQPRSDVPSPVVAPNGKQPAPSSSK